MLFARTLSCLFLADISGTCERIGIAAVLNNYERNGRRASR
jgi:hypothetical protein